MYFVLKSYTSEMCVFIYSYIYLNSSETVARCWYILLSGSVLMKDSMVLPPCRYVYIPCLEYIAGKVHIAAIDLLSHVKLLYVKFYR